MVGAASAMWAIVGVLIGVLAGAYLSDRNQRKRNHAGSKKEEYRELLSTLTQAAGKIADFHGPIVAHTPEEERSYYETKEKALITIDNRLFITTEIEKLDLRGRWISAVHDVEHGGHNLEFRRTVRQMIRQIISSARSTGE